MEGAGSKERFRNTPENEIRPDWSKLHPGGFRFQAMALKRHLTADAVLSEARTPSPCYPCTSGESLAFSRASTTAGTSTAWISAPRAVEAK